MVTIEQKLSLFSKLLHRQMNDKLTEEMEQLKKEYEVKIQKNKAAVDKEAEEIINKARRKAEAEKTELISKNRIGLKREYMSVKEKQVAVLMKRLYSEIDNFMQSEKYEAYLLSLVRKLADTEQLSENLIIYMTAGDSEKYGERIKNEFQRLHHAACSLRIAEDHILGGFIVEDPTANTRIDSSVEALLEDSRAYIMQTLFQAIEAGDGNG